jgi:hypothetical protein
MERQESQKDTRRPTADSGTDPDKQYGRHRAEVDTHGRKDGKDCYSDASNGTDHRPEQ